MLQQTIRRFAIKEIAPGAIARDEDCQFPTALIPKLAALNLLGINIPEQLGGGGLDTLSLAIIIEEIAAVDGATALIVASHNSLCTTHLYRFGNDDQRQKFVTPLAKGEILGAWGLTEAGSGSDAAAMTTQATREGDEWVLQGGKLFITQGSTAGIYVIMAKTDNAAGRNGISAFVVQAGTPGLLIGKVENKFGVRASDTAALHFQDLRIPYANLIGTLHQGYTNALSILDGGRIGIAAMAIGLARAAFEAARDYAKTRQQFGSNLSAFQAIQNKLADMKTEIEAARLLLYQAVFLKDTEQNFRLAASEAKLFASEVANRVTNQSLQIHGGMGYIKETQVDRFLRDAKLCEIGEGSSEIQRKIIAQTLLR